MLYLVTRVPMALLLDYFGVVPLKTWKDRSRSYLQSIRGNWLRLIPFAVIFLGLGWSPRTIGLQLPTNALLAASYFVISLLVSGALVFLGHALARHSSQVRAYLSRSAHPRALWPETTTEYWLFVPFSLTSGVVEELLFRGFMLTYLTRIFPSIPIVPAILLAACFFSIGHFNQKLAGVLGNWVIGVALSVLYYSTDSLILCMLVHALFNLRLLLMPRHSRGLKETSTESTPGTVSASSAAKSE